MEPLAPTAVGQFTRARGVGVGLALWIIRFYRLALSPVVGMHCRFHPSCSAYAEQAFIEHGFVPGLRLTLTRLARCHPWHPGGSDPVPEPIPQQPADS